MSAASVVRIVVGRSKGAGDLVSVLVWGEAGEAGLVLLQAEQAHASPFSTMSLYCASSSPKQAL